MNTIITPAPSTANLHRETLVALGRASTILDQLAEYWRYGSPVHPGSLIAVEAQELLGRLMSGPPFTDLYERPRTLSPVELALETAALIALRDEMHDWGGSYPCTLIWLRYIAALRAYGAIGAVKRTSNHETYKGWAIVWELYPDDRDYLGLCGDGRGDLFAVSREGVEKQISFDTEVVHAP